MIIPEITDVELIKWKGKEDLLLQELNTLWKNMRNSIDYLEKDDKEKSLEELKSNLQESIEFITEK